MLSTLFAIVKYVMIIAVIAVFLIFFIPLLIKWVTWAVVTAYGLLTTVPEWIIPIFSIGVILALISLGVKLL